MENTIQKTIEEILNNPANSFSQSSKDLLQTIAKQSDLNIVKAKKWQKLDEEIGRFYDTDCEELNGSDSEEGDLSDIGEVAARAFGYL
ncbi:MAG: hypothetical protein RSE50_00725 [Myroides sp.]